ncbi:MAG: hypothetical protein JRF42_08945 [Deltaproteobacteria bacterium]|nr:hypothetical protein [Deltaproteobacteria bacterium]
MNVSAKAVVLEVLSAGESIYEGVLPVRSLVQAASVFDIAENSVRVAIVRLRAEGLLESPGRGEYRLGPSAQVVNDKIHGWRTVSSRSPGPTPTAARAALPRLRGAQVRPFSETQQPDPRRRRYS